METQVVYETNADYAASLQKLYESGRVAGCEVSDYSGRVKGTLEFNFKGTETIFILSRYGKLEVKWKNPEEKKKLLELVEHYLVPKEGQKLYVNPIMQQLKIYYPAPPEFKVYWCDEKTQYYKSGCDPWIWTLAPLTFGFLLLCVAFSKK